MERTQAIDTYYKIKEKIHTIHYYWYVFKELNKQTNIEIINNTAPDYFIYSRDLFFHSVVLEIPASSRVKKLKTAGLYSLRIGDYRTIFHKASSSEIEIIRIVCHRELERILKTLI